MYQQQTVVAIILAAGESRRMVSVDKVWAPLASTSVLERVIGVFLNCDLIDRVVVVLNTKSLVRGRDLVRVLKPNKPIAICAGGRRRQDSVAAGLKRLGKCDWVVIHDGARPLVTGDLIEDGIAAAQETGAAICGLPTTDTIKSVVNRVIEKTLPRERLWSVQTPQVFRYDLIKAAYHQVDDEVTDDAVLVERLGYKVKVYMGSYANIKITIPDDLVLAECIINSKVKTKDPKTN